ncbi:hypothetical protein ACFQ9X_07390 [Catenulispora yoronensis]
MTAAALAGAFTGAVAGAVTALLDTALLDEEDAEGKADGPRAEQPFDHRALIREATAVALAPWRR